MNQTKNLKSIWNHATVSYIYQYYHQNVMALAVQSNPQTTLSNYSIDSVWAIVNILNETLTHDWEISKDDLKVQLSELNIPGLTVWIYCIDNILLCITNSYLKGQLYFDENGTRPTAQMNVYQFRDSE